MYYFMTNGKTIFGPFSNQQDARDQAEGYAGTYKVQILHEVAIGRAETKRVVHWDNTGGTDRT